MKFEILSLLNSGFTDLHVVCCPGKDRIIFKKKTVGVIITFMTAEHSRKNLDILAMLLGA